MTAVHRLRLLRKLRLVAQLLQTAEDTSWDLPQHKDSLIKGAREDVLRLMEEIRKDR